MAAGHRADSRTLAVEENLLSTADAARLSFEVTASFAVLQRRDAAGAVHGRRRAVGRHGGFTIQDRLAQVGWGWSTVLLTATGRNGRSQDDAAD